MGGEKKMDYRKGGFHPVHLDDTFKSARYKVLHKLGHGGFATVWLARDAVRGRYVALKILAARLSENSPEVEILRRLKQWKGNEEWRGNEAKGKEKEEDGNGEDGEGSQDGKMREEEDDTSNTGREDEQNVIGKQYVMILLDHFWINGPNGRHLCVVSEVGGPSIKQFNECPGLRMGSRRLRGDVARRVALQATQGLAFIHLTGIVHGDCTAANILIKLANIDEWTVAEIHERLGTPQTQKLHRVSGAAQDGSSPRYTVNAINMKMVDPKWLSDHIMIVDFGIAFHVAESSKSIGTPKHYCAPEFNFDSPRSVYSDIWALGCTIFEIRTGCSLFRYGGAPNPDQILIEMVKTLGSLPSIWWEVWKKGANWYELESLPGGQLNAKPHGNLHSLIMETGVYDGNPKLKRAKKDIEFGEDNAVSSEEKKTSSPSENPISTTSRLVNMVGELTTSEAAEVMALLGSRLISNSSGESGNKSSTSGGRSSDSGNKSGSASSGAKTGEKSVSSEGISTAPAATSNDVSETKHDIERTDPAIGAELLEEQGTVMTLDEASDLENLLRGSLAFLPEERSPASLLAKHCWFTTAYKNYRLVGI